MEIIKVRSFPILYRFIRFVVKFAMSIFFQKIELQNGENVPARGPVIFVANHPNSIMDALVMGLVTKRKVNYIGHAGLFSNKFKSWFLRSSGVIPIYRRVDAPDKMDQNVFAFQACYEVLEGGETIGIFPEGTSDMLRKVKKVKTGAARIALETEKRNDYQLGLKVIPIGLYFFSRSRFRSKVLMNVGEPVKLASFFELNEKDNAEAVQKLTEEIQQSLEQLTVNIRHEELDDFVKDIEILYGDELKIDSPDLQEVSEETVADFLVTQKIADCVEYYYERDLDRVRNFQAEVSAYKRKLKRLRLRDNMIKEKTTFSQLVKNSAVTFVRSLLGLPLALYGTVNNAIPYFLAENLARKFVDERTKILSALLIGGGIAFILFYSIQVFAVWFYFGKLWAMVYLISLPISGFFALAYFKQIRQEQERINLSFFLFTNRQLFNRMRRERKRLIMRMDEIRDEYRQLMGISPAAEATNKVSNLN